MNRLNWEQLQIRKKDHYELLGMMVNYALTDL